jgi:hypothetical protein
MTAVRDRAECLITAIFQMMDAALRPHLLELLRNELAEAEQEGFRQAQEMRRDE